MAVREMSSTDSSRFPEHDAGRVARRAAAYPRLAGARRPERCRLPTPQQLLKGAQHANYEIAMLLDTEARLRGLPSSGADTILQRALIESWAVHLRALIEFFHPRLRPYADTVLAEWYVTDRARWHRALPKLTERERLRRQALHRHLAHISFLRDARKTRWSSSDHRIVTRRLSMFKEHLDRHYRRVFAALTMI